MVQKTKKVKELKFKDLSEITASEIMKKVNRKSASATKEQTANHFTPPRPTRKSLVQDYKMVPAIVKLFTDVDLNIWWNC